VAEVGSPLALAPDGSPLALKATVPEEPLDQLMVVT